MSNIIIELKELKKYFKTKHGNLHAVDGINIKLEKGKTLGIVGESGCGKTTLGRTVIGLTSATDGEVIYNGENTTKYKIADKRKMWKNIQLIFQDPYSSINPRHTISRIIEEPLINSGLIKNKKKRKVKVLELMETVGLSNQFYDSYPHELDGGRRQRVGIARALATEPEIIIFDEPVSALDVSVQAQILNLLMKLKEEKQLTYMFITHDLSVVRHISDEIMVMYLGQCVERGPAKKMFDAPKHPYTKALLSAIPLPSIEARAQEFEPIKGEITSPINPKPSCRFAPRCSIASEACIGKNIPLKEVDDEHFVACISI